jgi:hypothetical protein
MFNPDFDPMAQLNQLSEDYNEILKRQINHLEILTMINQQNQMIHNRLVNQEYRIKQLEEFINANYEN